MEYRSLLHSPVYAVNGRLVILFVNEFLHLALAAAPLALPLVQFLASVRCRGARGTGSSALTMGGGAGGDVPGLSVYSGRAAMSCCPSGSTPIKSQETPKRIFLANNACLITCAVCTVGQSLVGQQRRNDAALPCCLGGPRCLR